MHHEEIAFEVAASAHAVALLDQAGWHGIKDLVNPPNVTLLPRRPLPSASASGTWVLIDAPSSGAERVCGSRFSRRYVRWLFSGDGWAHWLRRDHGSARLLAVRSEVPRSRAGSSAEGSVAVVWVRLVAGARTGRCTNVVCVEI